MDNDLEAKRIREFLPRFIDFKERIKEQSQLFIAVDSMWEGTYRVLLNDGNAFELAETLLDNPSFDLIFEKGKPIDAKNILL